MKCPFRKLEYPIKGASKSDSVAKFVQVFTYDPLLNLLEFHNAEGFAQLFDSTFSDKALLKIDAQEEKEKEPLRRVAIMTTGKETSGMNSAIRALVRYGLTKGILPYIVFNGFQGLVQGNHSIKKADWEDVRGLLPLGGSVLDTSNAESIQSRENRRLAAKNLYINDIDVLFIIGDNESFDSALTLQSEWNELIHELIRDHEIEPKTPKLLRSASSIVQPNINPRPITKVHSEANTNEDSQTEQFEDTICTIDSSENVFLDSNNEATIDNNDMTYHLSVLALPACIDNDIAMTGN